MGYRPKVETAKVIGADEYEGLEAEVVIRPVSFGMLLDLEERMNSGDAAQIKAAMQEFGDAILRSWNLEDQDGKPVPADGAGMLSQDSALMSHILGGWMEVMQRPPLASGGPSRNGHMSEPETRLRNGAASPSSTGSADGGGSRRRPSRKRTRSS